MNRKRKSIVWNYFEKDVGPKKMAKCRLCSTEYRTSGNTSNLKDHLKRKHPSSYASIASAVSGETEIDDPMAMDKERPSKGLRFYLSKSDSYEKNSKKYKERLNFVCQYIALGFHPFSVVDEPGFQKLLKGFDEKFTMPSRRTIVTVTEQFFQTGKKELKKMLNQIKICAITTDIWTSINMQSFITITCHFLIDNKLESAVLATRIIQGNHTAVNIATTIDSILTEFGILQKVKCVVTDNAANMKAAVTLINKGKPRHLPCVAHTLNLVVSDAMAAEECSDFLEITNKCKRIVTYFRSSTVASDKLASVQKEHSQNVLKLIQEVPTRWNSLFLMMRRILQLKDVLLITLASLSLPDSPELTREELDIINEAVLVLGPFFEATEDLSGEKYATVSGIIPLVKGISLNLRTAKCKIKKDPVKKLLNALNEGMVKRMFPYEERTVCKNATAVDPRFKKRGFRKEENYTSATKLLINEVTSAMDSRMNKMDSVPVPSTSTAEGHKNEPKDNEKKSSLLSFLKNTGTSENISNRADAYIIWKQYGESPLIDENEDPLKYWAEKVACWEPLAEVAFSFLLTPASSTPSERVFSTAGYILNDRRNRLSHEHVDMLVFLHHNYSLLKLDLIQMETNDEEDLED